MRLTKGQYYHLRFLDHTESEGKEYPKGVLNVVGRFVKESKGYLIFCNWWSDDLEDNVQTRANVLKKAVIEVRELK